MQGIIALSLVCCILRHSIVHQQKLKKEITELSVEAFEFLLLDPKSDYKLFAASVDQTSILVSLLCVCPGENVNCM